MNTGLTDDKELSKKLRTAFAEAGLIKTNKLLSTPLYPAYRYEMATGEYWNDLAPYRTQLVESVRFFWTEFEPRIRGVLEG